MLNTRFIEVLDYENLDARVQSVVTEDLSAEEYDLAHTRFTLAHIAERDLVVAKMLRSLKPGGWLLIEDPDFSTEDVAPGAESTKRQLFESGTGALREFQRQRRMDPYYGHTLAGKPNTLGLQKVKAVGRSLTVQVGTPAPREVALTIEQLQTPAIATGLIFELDYLNFRSLFDDGALY